MTQPLRIRMIDFIPVWIENNVWLSEITPNRLPFLVTNRGTNRVYCFV